MCIFPQPPPSPPPGIKNGFISSTLTCVIFWHLLVETASQSFILCVHLKVREATSNDPWGPSSSLMSEIADLTYNVVAFSEIMSMVWKRLNDHGKNWRHVYKVGAFIYVQLLHVRVFNQSFFY